MSATSKSGHTFKAERVVFFTDAVMAVAITVLVLDLKLPEGMNAGDLDGALASVWRPFWCYALSFVVIGVLWTAHLRQFDHVARVDGVLLWLNLGFLMAVALIPFVTSVLSDYGGTLATVLYAGVLTASCLLLAAGWGYATRRSELLGGEVAAELRRTGVLTPLLVAGVFALSIGIAYGFGASAAQWSWVLAALSGPVADRLSRA